MGRWHLVLAAVLLAGCSMLPPPAGIQLEIPARPETRALPVTVVDGVGIVAGARPAEPSQLLDPERIVAVEPVAGRDDVVVVRWMGGDCDDRAIVTIEPAGERYAVSVESRSSAMSCSAVGVLRAVQLTLTTPAGAEAFDTP